MTVLSDMLMNIHRVSYAVLNTWKSMEFNFPFSIFQGQEKYEIQSFDMEKYGVFSGAAKLLYASIFFCSILLKLIEI